MPALRSAAGATARALRLADVNRDGRPDLVVHHPTLRDGRRAIRAGRRHVCGADPFPRPYAFNPQTELHDHGGEEDISASPSVGD